MPDIISNHIGEAAALTAACLWAIATIFFQKLGRHFGPLLLNILKGIIATAMLLVAIIVFHDYPDSLNYWALLLFFISGGVGIGIGDTAYFKSLEYLGARRALLMGTLAPPLAGFLSYIFLGETLSPKAWAGILIACIGIAWVITEKTPQDKSGHKHLIKGLAICLVFAFSQAIGSVISRMALVQYNYGTLFSAFIRLAAGVIFLLPVLAVRHRFSFAPKTRNNLNKAILLLVGTTIFGTFIALWLQQVSLKYTQAGIAQTLLSTSPIFILPISFFMGEKVSMRAVFGAIITMCGISFFFGLF